eukprot:gene24772-10412_t
MPKLDRYPSRHESFWVDTPADTEATGTSAGAYASDYGPEAFTTQVVRQFWARLLNPQLTKGVDAWETCG